MINLTEESVTALLRGAVAERGAAYVYQAPRRLGRTPRCLYVHPSTRDRAAEAGCGAGWVLHKAGVPLDTLYDYEGDNVGSVISRLATAGALSYEPYARSMLRRFQLWQDRGHPWGVCLEKALDASAPFLVPDLPASKE